MRWPTGRAGVAFGLRLSAARNGAVTPATLDEEAPMSPNLHPLRARWRALSLPGSLCAVAVLLSACGGSDGDDNTGVVVPPPVVPAVVAVSGVVADGPLKDATSATTSMTTAPATPANPAR